MAVKKSHDVPVFLVFWGTKGGVGRTTIAAYLAAALAEEAEKTALIDLDMNGNGVAGRFHVRDKGSAAGGVCARGQIGGADLYSVEWGTSAKPAPWANTLLVREFIKSVLSSRELDSYKFCLVDLSPSCADYLMEIAATVPIHALLVVDAPSHTSVPDACFRSLALAAMLAIDKTILVKNMTSSVSMEASKGEEPGARAVWQLSKGPKASPPMVVFPFDDRIHKENVVRRLENFNDPWWEALMTLGRLVRQ